MNIKDEGTCRTIAEKLRERKKKSPLTVGEEMDLTFSVYRKDAPTEKCGTLKIKGALDLSLVKVGAFLAAIIVGVRLLGLIKNLLRKKS